MVVGVAMLGCRVTQGGVLVQLELDLFGSLSGVCLILGMGLQASPLMMGLGLAEEVWVPRSRTISAVRVTLSAATL